MGIHKPIIKICGITRPEDAEISLGCGAHEVGMIFHPPSRRHVSVERAKLIAQTAREAGGVPVAVFVEASGDTIRRTCEACAIRHVQLHGRFTREAIQDLLREFKVRGVLRVGEEGDILEDDRIQWEPHVHEIHCLVYDSTIAGSGQRFNWLEFSPISSGPWLLAGGLTPENVGGAIRALGPFGVDVSSGVEGQVQGVKDLRRVKSFIEEVNSLCPAI